jgi:hypothetical protein
MEQQVRHTLGVVWALTMVCCLLVIMACVPNETVVASYPLNSIDSIDELAQQATTAEVAKVAGGPALKLEGLLLVPEVELTNLGVEVEILAEQACYPGIVFRLTDSTSFELAYAVPHASGQPDAIQYDPVFGGSNTWQLHSGPAYQQSAQVPIGEWFTLRLEVEGERAVVQVGDQPPLVVERLSHGTRRGRVGLWTFRPAFFRNLKVSVPRALDDLCGVVPVAPSETITEWHLEGVGEVACELNGVLNLNRFLAPTPDEVRLTRRFEAGSAGEVELGVGFSDTLALRLDGELLFEGENTFKGFDDLASRGWVAVSSVPVRAHVAAGEHELEATLRMTEPFGWGQIITLSGPNLRLLPVTEKLP